MGTVPFTPLILSRRVRIRIVVRENLPIRVPPLPHHRRAMLTHAHAVSRAVTLKHKPFTHSSHFIKVAENPVPSQRPADREPKRLGIDRPRKQSAHLYSLHPSRHRTLDNFDPRHAIHTDGLSQIRRRQLTR